MFVAARAQASFHLAQRLGHAVLGFAIHRQPDIAAPDVLGIGGQRGQFFRRHRLAAAAKDDFHRQEAFLIQIQHADRLQRRGFDAHRPRGVAGHDAPIPAKLFQLPHQKERDGVAVQRHAPRGERLHLGGHVRGNGVPRLALTDPARAAGGGCGVTAAAATTVGSGRCHGQGIGREAHLAIRADDLRLHGEIVFFRHVHLELIVQRAAIGQLDGA